MKRLQQFSPIILALAFVVSSPEPAHAGTRYKDIVFPTVKLTKDIKFGQALNTGGSIIPLLLDFYEPTGDTVSARPLVICLHGGSLVTGDRNSMDAFCSDFAKRGYVAATIDYRVGIELPKGKKTIVEALLRGVQDTKAAVRFFRSNAALYRIDTAKIFLEGSSAGSMIAVHHAYWNQDEIPSDVNQVKWGNIEGTSGNPGFSSAVKAIVNYCGAITDPAWIDAEEAAVANFHGLLDAVVPAESGVSSEFGIDLYGGVTISRIATQLGIYNQGAFFPQMGHGGNEDSLRVFSANFLYTLIVLSSASPQDFSSMALPVKSVRVFRYETYTFTTTALDKSGNRIILPQPMIQYSCNARIGTIKPSGVFTPSDRPDSGYVYAKFNNVMDSCYVRTYGFKYFLIKPRIAVTDTSHPLKLTIDTYDADSVRHDLAITRFTLSSTVPSVGTIDSLGMFTAKKNGTTKIIASLNNFSDTSTVRVESASGMVSLDALETLSGWSYQGTNLDSLSVKVVTDQKSAGSASFRIDYRFTYDQSIPSYMVYLDKDLQVFGIPDSLYLDVKSDGRRHRLTYAVSDANSGMFRAVAKKFLNNSQTFDLINTPMTGLTPLAGTTQAAYPLTVKRIEIQLGNDGIQGQPNSGSIYIDNLRLKYPGTATAVESGSPSPLSFSLGQNYPNPFNPSTTIRYTVSSRTHVALVVYNVLGQRVCELVNGELNAGRYEIRFDAAGLASGVYLYRLTAGTFAQTLKLVVVK